MQQVQRHDHPYAAAEISSERPRRDRQGRSRGVLQACAGLVRPGVVVTPQGHAQEDHDKLRHGGDEWGLPAGQRPRRERLD